MLHIKEYTVFIKHISVVFFENTRQHLSDRLQPLPPQKDLPKFSSQIRLTEARFASEEPISTPSGSGPTTTVCLPTVHGFSTYVAAKGPTPRPVA